MVLWHGLLMATADAAGCLKQESGSRLADSKAGEFTEQRCNALSGREKEAPRAPPRAVEASGAQNSIGPALALLLPSRAPSAPGTSP